MEGLYINASTAVMRPFRTKDTTRGDAFSCPWAWVTILAFKRAQGQVAGPAALRKVILPVDMSFRSIGFYGKVTILKDSALMAVLDLHCDLSVPPCFVTRPQGRTFPTGRERTVWFQCRPSSRLPRELGDSLFMPKEWSNVSTSSDFPWKCGAGFA